jgi:hypothetical protein
MTIQIPDNPIIASKARAAGFDSIDEYVRHLIEQDVGDAGSEPVVDPSLAVWQQRFQDLLASVEPGNPQVDDSRESIYVDR